MESAFNVVGVQDPTVQELQKFADPSNVYAVELSAVDRASAVSYLKYAAANRRHIATAILARWTMNMPHIHSITYKRNGARALVSLNA